ncbi:aminotransferase class I/II-fold pyridoxal phosphate-dependent enzyme [Vibrio salinus]|uniref:aminotransferase class I/II-fold pyridoxal phosphate-dependent enzyme n=1 Tax=Vibrio salinus TaxID=2899784 RepID=UPI001E3E02DB|nr:pyridoxal phosphate-dependent aminotransferase [Vibrio salinus]MCE0495272.1 pyridoxal phosphate-dependent aminotransferase [Vibrio salinus]
MKFDFQASSTPIPSENVIAALQDANIPDLETASIRRLSGLINKIESLSGEKFIRMEMGVPGISAPKVGIQAEIEALKSGVASHYPPLTGIPSLKTEIARFVKSFLNVDVNSEYCYPTVGSAQGAMATFMVANRIRPEGATLFIDPGFPNQKAQVTALGQSWDSFDVYNYRGEVLRNILEEKLSTGQYTTLLYSNPNNPAWICFNDNELKIIAEVAENYDVIIVEDLAYLGMDYRSDYSVPNQAPFQPTVAKYAKDYILLISSSKVFSYAGQRIGSLIISEHLAQREFVTLQPTLGYSRFEHAMVFGGFHPLSSGVTHSVQYGLAAMMKAVNDGENPFLKDTQVYQKRAAEMKRLFTEHGFYIVYDKDIDKPIGDGFYFTFAYPGLSSGELLETLLYFGISAISLMNTGSERNEGLRACVSQVHESQFPLLEERIKAFSALMGE